MGRVPFRVVPRTKEVHTPAETNLSEPRKSPLVSRLARAQKRPKVRIGISPDPGLLEWVDQNTGPGKRFATRTHAFEAGIACMAELAKGGAKGRPGLGE
jgi:hypothetical protein